MQIGLKNKQRIKKNDVNVRKKIHNHNLRKKKINIKKINK